MKAAITEDDVLRAIQELQALGERATRQAIIDRIGGSQRTLQRIMDRLRDLGAIVAPDQGLRLLQASLSRRTTQVDALIAWSVEVLAVAAAAGLTLPPVPEEVGPARLGKPQWPWPTPAGSDREQFVITGLGGGRGRGGSTTGSARGTRGGYPQGWVPTQAVDIHKAMRESRGQIVVCSDCASIKTPAPEGSRIPGDGSTADRRSVPPRTDGSARHPDRWAGGMEADQ